MKKLLDIIKLPALNDCNQLESDFKTQRHNLKRYLKSLKELKLRAKIAHQYFANSLKTSNEIVQNHWDLKKKNSEIDYFLVNGVKMFKIINTEMKKIENFYQSINIQAKDLIEKLEKYLDHSKHSFTRTSTQHEKMVKDYAEKCFPHTTTILYFLGFSNVQKIQKIEDKMKEQSLLKETEMYSTVLNNYLDQMENIKTQITKLSQQFYIGATQLFMNCNIEIQRQLQSYEINQEEVEAYFKETGGATTDRSDKSYRDEHNQGI